MGSTLKPWMVQVSGEVAHELDLLANEDGVKRAIEHHYLLGLGIMLRKKLGDSEVIKNLLGKSEPKASITLAGPKPGEPVFVPTVFKAKRKAKKAPTVPSLVGVIRPVDGFMVETPSSPAESVSDTLPPSAPFESASLTEAELAALPDEAKLNPFDALNDDAPEPEQDDLDAFADSLLGVV